MQCKQILFTLPRVTSKSLIYKVFVPTGSYLLFIHSCRKSPTLTGIFCFSELISIYFDILETVKLRNVP